MTKSTISSREDEEKEKEAISIVSDLHPKNNSEIQQENEKDATNRTIRNELSRDESADPISRKTLPPPAQAEPLINDNQKKAPSTEIPPPPQSTTLPNFSAPIAISMSGCGFLCSYHIGAMMCFQKHAKTLLSNVHMFCGASAGSLVASLMVLAPDKLEVYSGERKGLILTIQDALKRIYELADKVPNILMYNFDKNFNIDQQLAELVNHHLPQDISAANGRLVISLTKQKDFSNHLVNKFSGRDHLMQCLFASCYIPYYTRSNPPVIDGEVYIDGGLSNNLPMISGMHTITISPYSGNAKIAPMRTSREVASTLLSFDLGQKITFGQQQLNVNWENIVRIYRSLYPRPIFPSKDNTVLISRYYEQGYRDTMNYLLKRGYYERSETEGSEV